MSACGSLGQTVQNKAEQLWRVPPPNFMTWVSSGAVVVNCRKTYCQRRSSAVPAHMDGPIRGRSDMGVLLRKLCQIPGFLD